MPRTHFNTEKTVSVLRHDNPVLKAVNGLLSTAGADGGSTVVGVSGGADSVALLRALLSLRDDSSDELVVAHLDHGLRPDSVTDADWVTKLATTFDVPAVVERIDVAEFAATEGLGTEEAARRCRYDFFRRVAAEHGCRYVAVAHTADDQAETILHHLLRGTGLAGLRGMPESRDLEEHLMLVRPLLDVTREEVISYLEGLGQSYLTDESNRDEQFTRNRLRHTLLPLLRDQFNPRVSESLRRLGEQARDVQMIVESLAAELLSTAAIEQQPDRVALKVAPLASEPRHLLREAFRLLFVQQNWPRGRMRFDDWDNLAALAQASQAAKSLTLPAGMTARLHRGIVTIERS